MTELKPCPFCGEEPHVAANDDTIIIECKTVNCPASPITTGDLLIDAFKAATAWNRRADLPPKVKPLVWSTDGFPRAVTILGEYVVLEWRRGPQLTFNRGATQVIVMDCDSTEAAKAAAQADYETRILAALVQP